jgi:hypothetical protein
MQKHNSVEIVIKYRLCFISEYFQPKNEIGNKIHRVIIINGGKIFTKTIISKFEIIILQKYCRKIDQYLSKGVLKTSRDC